MAQPFVWTGNTGQVGTPQQARDAREVAALLAQGRQKVAQNGWEGLAQLSNAWAERGWRDQAAQAEEAGIKSAAEALAGITPQSGFADIAGALSNPWLSQPQSTIAAALLQQNLQSQDPAYQLDLAYKQAQIDKMNAEAAGGGTEYFGSTIPWQDASGNLQYYQLRKGEGLPMLPEGARWLEPTTTVNTGTQHTILGRNTGQVQGGIGIDSYQPAYDSAAGSAEAKSDVEAAAAAPADVQTGEMALDLINQIKTHPELEWATGTSAGLGGNAIPGTGRYDFQNLVEQAKSGAFLSAIQQMRGMGSLSNAEGQAATQAVTRMNTATSTEAFLKAVDDYERIVRAGLNKARGRLSGGAPTESLSPTSSEVIDWRDL